MALCMNCMNEIGDSEVCPYCGFDGDCEQKAPYLPFGTLLRNRYIVGKVIDSNGESACYRGYDKTNQNIVRIREFLPIGIFERTDGERILRITEENENIYDGLFNDFVRYYRVLNGLKGHSANVEIYELFPENNTCYVIEEEEELLEFSEYVERSGGRLGWDTLRPMLMPVISLLEAMHSHNIGHYALSPSNVRVTPSGKLKLLRCSTENVRRRGTPLKSSLPAGIAAPEQYAGRTLDEQTDVYCFTALLFYALSGRLPPEAPKRTGDGKLYMNTSAAKRLPPYVLNALVNGLWLNRSKRITSFEQLRSQLSAESTVEAIREEISRTAMMKSVGREENDEKPRRSRVPIFIISFLLTAMVVAGIFVLLYSNGFFDNTVETEPPVSATETVAETEWTGPVINNLVGMSYEDARLSLENTGIELVRSYATVYSDVYEEGVIVSQRPEAGTPISSSDGSAVIYVEVSSGSKTRELPDIIGYTLDSASEVLGDYGLIISETLEDSDTVAEGCVIGYDGYDVGDRVEVGSTVVIRVSRGSGGQNNAQ